MAPSHSMQRSVRLVAVNRLMSFERAAQTAGDSECGFIGDILQLPLELTAAPTDHQKLFTLAAVTVTERANDFVLIGLHTS